MLEVAINTTLQYFVPHNEVKIRRHKALPITPELIYMVRGMDAKTDYQVKLQLKLLENYPNKCSGARCDHRWCFKTGIAYWSHANSGKFWMSNGIDLSYVNISNKKSKEQNCLYAVHDHFYTPVLTIIDLKTKEPKEFSFDALNFLGVRVYRNPWIQKLKIARFFVKLDQCACVSLTDSLQCVRRQLNGNCQFYQRTTGRRGNPAMDYKQLMYNLDIEMFYRYST